MAKQRYDVNTTIKLLETTKQFTGGLKTVDTDDSLGAFYLRDCENISLSNYGFIEKRYGLVDSLEVDTSEISLYSKKIQGYFEYKRADGYSDQILFIDGNLYLKRFEDTDGHFENDKFLKVTQLHLKEDEKYVDPELFTNYLNEYIGVSGGYGSFDKIFVSSDDIEAVRIEDSLYIFTGVYPIIYEGDGKFYPLPEYSPSFSELKAFSHNIHNADNGYYYIEEPEGLTSVCLVDYEDESEVIFEFIEDTTYPKLPFINTSGSIFNSKITYKINSDLIPSTPFTGFLDSAGVPQTTGGILVDISPRVYYRAAGSVSDLEWIELERSSLIYEPRANFGTGLDASSFLTYPSGTTLTLDELDYYTMDIETSQYVTIANGQIPYRVGLTNMPVGFYDLKVDLVLRRSGYENIGEGDPVYRSEVISTVSRVYKDITFTEEKLQDYTSIDPAGLWTCNRVINHYGKLMAYGSDLNTETVYVGHPTIKHYFPVYFTMEFNTDDNQEIQKITPFMNILVVQSESYTWGVKGTDALIEADDPYSQFTINPIYGTIAPKSVQPVRNQLYFLSKEGLVSLNSLYANDSQYNIKHIDQNIANIVPLDRDAVATQFDNQYWIHFPNTKNHMTLRYYIDNKSWVKDTYFEWDGLVDGEPNPSVSDFNGVYRYFRKDGELYFVANPSLYDSEGNYAIKKILVDYSFPSDLGEAPKTLFETAYMNQSYPFHPKKYLEQKFDFTIQNEYNFSKDGAVYSEEGIDPDLTYVFELDNTVLKKNHKYRLAYIEDDVTSLTAPIYALTDVTQYKNNIIVGQETIPTSKAATPILFNIQTNGTTLLLKIINNDLENADLYYAVDTLDINDLENTARVVYDVGTRNVTDELIFENLSEGVHILSAVAKTSATQISEVVSTEIQISATSKAPVIADVGVGDVTVSSVTLNWTDNNLVNQVPSSEQFKVGYRNVSSGSAWSADVTGITGTTYTVSGLSAGYEYEFRVSAYFIGEWSPYDYYIATTSYGLDQVQDLVVSGTSSPVSVSWTDLNSTETEYRYQYRVTNVYWDDSTPTPVVLGPDVVNTTQSVSTNTVYDFRVRGYDSVSDLLGAWSTVDQHIVLAAISAPVSTASTTSSITFTYGNYGTATSYQMWYKATSSGTWIDLGTLTYAEASTAGFSKQLTGLAENTSYDIKYLVNFTVDGILIQTSEASLTTSTAAPAPVVTANPTIGTTTITETGIVWYVTNNDGSTATVWAERGDSTPDVSRGDISSGYSTTNIYESNLNAGTNYTLYAQAQASGELASSVVSKTVTTSPLSIPATPSGLYTSSGIMYWTDNAFNEYNYTVQIAEDINFATILINYVGLPMNLTSYNCNSLDLATGYSYFCRVRCYNSAGFSSWSNTAMLPL